MMNITIPDIDDALQASLRARAADHGHSIEDEARAILRAALDREPLRAGSLVASIRAKFAPLGGMELPSTLREPIREPPSFDE